MTEIEIIAHLSRALAELPLLRENVRILEEANLQLQRELGYVRGEAERLRRAQDQTQTTVSPASPETRTS